MYPDGGVIKFTPITSLQMVCIIDIRRIFNGDPAKAKFVNQQHGLLGGVTLNIRQRLLINLLIRFACRS